MSASRHSSDPGLCCNEGQGTAQQQLQYFRVPTLQSWSCSQPLQFSPLGEQGLHNAQRKQGTSHDPQNAEAAGGHRPLGQTDTERRRLRSKLEQKDCVFIPTTLGLARGGSHTFWYLNLESRPRALRRPRSAWAHLQRGQAPAARPLLTPGQLLHGTNSAEAFGVSSCENRGEGARGCSGTARHLPTAQQRKGGG